MGDLHGYGIVALLLLSVLSKKVKNSLKGRIFDIDGGNLPEVFDDLKILDYDWV